ncbi:hypothetical protein ANANG_G00095120 [Anguilla anguilla]|uniref:Uncharacterized protein n=1 Tax=Anguilla anguilla TaxID=7936 RepID=A0A9D3RYQ1_ANGAN|nr:hypothetical protein ANANG_G00095120 [Anguilla anguilla]
MVTARSCVRVITCCSNISHILPDPQLFCAMGDKCGLDFKDIETKLGRKIPESLARSITEGRLEGTMDEKPVTPSVPFNQESTNASVRLQRKMTFLKQEMARLRAMDIELMQQLLTINDGIESIKWVMEERGPGGQPGRQPGGESVQPVGEPGGLAGGQLRQPAAGQRRAGRRLRGQLPGHAGGGPPACGAGRVLRPARRPGRPGQDRPAQGQGGELGRVLLLRVTRAPGRFENCRGVPRRWVAPLMLLGLWGAVGSQPGFLRRSEVTGSEHIIGPP